MPIGVAIPMPAGRSSKSQSAATGQRRTGKALRHAKNHPPREDDARFNAMFPTAPIIGSSAYS
eukprot:6186332-Amphidinium_carterae.2